MRRTLTTVAVLALAACAGTNDVVSSDDCVQPPCALPLAVTVGVTSSVSGAAVANAFVSATKPFAGTFPCGVGPDGTCPVLGTAGTYELDVGAPGYQTVHRTVTVAGTTPPCGCVQLQTQHLDVALVPNG